MSAGAAFADALARVFASGPTIHAGAVMLHGAGIVIRGPSGSGKSRLALELMERHGARLVADDRAEIARIGEGPDAALIARAPAALAGMMEIRGLGLVRPPFERLARIRLVVDLVDENTIPRLPHEADRKASLAGIEMPRLGLAIGDRLGAMLVDRAIVTRERFGDDGVALTEAPPS